MVDEMTPEVIYQSVQATPRPLYHVPTCADELLEELGSAELFKRVLAIGYMDWQGFEKNRRKRLGEKYKPKHHPRGCHKIRHFHFKTDGSQTRCSINREDTQRSKMLKAEKGGRSRGQDSYRIPCSFP